MLHSARMLQPRRCASVSPACPVYLSPLNNQTQASSSGVWALGCAHDKKQEEATHGPAIWSLLVQAPTSGLLLLGTAASWSWPSPC